LHTPLAHIVTKRDCLLRHFFFDRNTPTDAVLRSSSVPSARDLVSLGDNFAKNTSVWSLSKNRSVASACQVRQFDKLISSRLAPHTRRPIAIVIDALDEGYDLETLESSATGTRASWTFAYSITSRPLDAIVTDLAGADHIQRRSIDYTWDIIREIFLCMFAIGCSISRPERLAVEWPGAQRTKDFTIKAEGLFIWVSLVSEYLRTGSSRQKALDAPLREKSGRLLRRDQNGRSICRDPQCL